ncbi:MAG: hypothetical protein COA71_03220 [SAR86 cluster bacterium]|uniref:Hsp70 family protein n=1 Tax=SAR86 cluster bacterium TaxID=2030880 RepID=A0A2A5CF88_9GAMM|nr:MAG: hypothetical protein COA71_03220 [SAR86 cluster bacterium]
MLHYGKIPAPLEGSEKIGIGVDYGTSNTAAAIFDGHRVHLVKLEEHSSIMPTAVYIDRDFNARVGQQAVSDYIVANQGRKVELSAEVLGEVRTTTGQVDQGTSLPAEANTSLVYGQSFQDASMPGRLFRGIKRLLGRKSSERIMVFDRPFRLVALVTPILLRVHDCLLVGMNKIGLSNSTQHVADHACIGHPVNFEGHSQAHNKLALERLQEACGHAGIKYRNLFAEPNAAVMSYLMSQDNVQAKVILTVDFGGGTLDFCVLAEKEGGYEVIGTHGVGLGGDHIDQTLFRSLLFPLLGKGERWQREVDGCKVETLFPFEPFEELIINWTVSYMLNQNEYLTPVRDKMSKGGDAAHKFERLYDLITQNYSYQVFQRLKECKETLSSQEEALLDIPEINVSLTLTRQKFNELIAQSLEQFSTAVSDTLEKAGLTDTDVSLVIRTGGSCLIHAVTQILEQRFPGRVVEHDPFTSVAAGLAIADYQMQKG